MLTRTHRPLTGRAVHGTLALLGLVIVVCPLRAEEATATDDWKVEANKVIEALRKRDAEVTVVDAEGNPLDGAKVQIVQTKKGFPFGAAISAGFTRNRQLQETFKRMFNYAVFGNESKWYSNESSRGRTNYRAADELLEWCEANGIPVHGHCIFWEPVRWQPRWVQSLRGDQLRQALENRLVDAVTHFKGRFVSWDVNNETLHGTFYVDNLGEEIRPWMFQRAKELDPDAKLFVNDFNVLSVDQDFTEVQTEEYLAHVQRLLELGAPIDCVGVQGHVWTEDVLGHPEVIRQRLDIVAKAGLPIWISEFDVADNNDKVRADKMELVYRTAYGHPAVEGIITWSFWAGGSWRGPNAAMVNRDFSLNEEGRRFEELMQQWSTSVDLETDAEGRCEFRGFHGEYSASVEVPEAEALAGKFTLEVGEGPQVVELRVE